MFKIGRHSPVLIPALVAILINWTGFAVWAQTNSGRPPSAKTVSIFAQNDPRLPKSASSAFADRTLAGTNQFDQRPLNGNLPLFVPPVTYEPEAGAGTVVVADVNMDGKQDVVVGAGCVTHSCVRVLLGNGDGTLQPGLSYPTGPGSPAVAVGDVNGDGKPDLVVANQGFDTEESLVVLFGNGDGTFQPFVKLWQGFTGAVAVADFNGDGTLDISVVNWWLGTVGVLLGDGNGAFAKPVFYDTGGAGPWAIAIADLNHDHKPDLVVTNSESGNVGVLLGNGDGTFQAAAIYSSTGYFNIAVVVADVNKDGIPDLVVANGDYAEIGVLLGNGDGTFRPAVSYGYGGYSDASSIAVADADGDGKLDLLVANNHCGDVNVCGAVDIFLGNGDGTFRFYNAQPAPGIRALALANLDRNGKSDLVLAMNSVGVMLHVGNTPTSTTVAAANNPSIYGEAVILTALANSASGIPPGSVEFFDGSSALASTPW